MRKSLLWIGAGAVALGAMAGGALMVGCTQDVGSSSSQRPDISTLSEGVNLIDTKDPGVQMAAAYKAGSRVVFFETAVGPMKPEVYRQMAPNEPQFEMDMRIVDKNGHTFYAVRGGDTFVNPDWDKEIAASAKMPVEAKEREADFRLAKEGASALAGMLPASFADHTFHVANFAARPVPMDDPHMIEKAQRIANVPLPQTPYGTWTSASSVWLETDLYSGQVCWAWICPAWHSATIMWAYQNGGWNFALNACNHGRCYGDSGMGYQCYSNGGWYGTTTLYGETNSGGNTSVSSACLTPYSWNDGTGQHLCNNDAEYELWQAKNNQGGGNTPYGNGWSFQFYNGNNFSCGPGSHSGDWSRPPCP